MGKFLSSMTESIEILENTFILHASGGLYWEDQSSLLISDIHLGKITHFRRHGSAVPRAVIRENFRKLEEVQDYFRPSRIIFLGDLFHSSLNSEWILFREWIEQQASTILLIEGNHDIISPHKYEELGVQILQELAHDNFLLSHKPQSTEYAFNLAGHVHPGIRVQGKGRQSLRLPCFFRSNNQMILPAFGAFTGKHLLIPQQGDQVFIITPGEVIPFSPGRGNLRNDKI